MSILSAIAAPLVAAPLGAAAHFVLRFPLGATVNAVAIVVGSVIGMLAGKFFKDQAEAASSEESRDLEKAQRLWDASCSWCGITDFGRPPATPHSS